MWISLAVPQKGSIKYSNCLSRLFNYNRSKAIIWFFNVMQTTSVTAAFSIFSPLPKIFRPQSVGKTSLTALTWKENLHSKLIEAWLKRKKKLHRHLTQALLFSNHLSSTLATIGAVCWHLKLVWCYFGHLQRSAADGLILCGEGF